MQSEDFKKAGKTCSRDGWKTSQNKAARSSSRSVCKQLELCDVINIAYRETLLLIILNVLQYARSLHLALISKYELPAF